MAAESPSQASAPSKISSSYIPALDGLRAIAFFCVFGAHTNGRTFAKYVPATFGVTLFFFLSGYLITTLLRGEAQKTGSIKLKDFYIRRALRIFIPMYIAFAVSELVGKISFGDWNLNPMGFFSSLFYFYNYALMFHPHPILPRGFDVIWSLCVEEHFYLMFPLMYLTMLRSRISRETQGRILLALCVVGLCWRTYVSYHGFPEFWTYFTTDCRFDSILWGCLLAVWSNPVYDAPSPLLKRWGGTLAATSVLVILSTMVIGKLHFISAEQSGRYDDTLRYSLQGLGLYFIFHFAISNINHWSVHWLENRALRYIGWLSYSLYLIHMTFEHSIERYPQISSWVASPTVFVISVGYAFAMRHMVEQPIQKLRARFRHTAAPVSAAMPVEGI